MTANTAGVSSQVAVGHRLLGEIEETSLEDVLLRIRTSVLAREQTAAAVATASSAPAPQVGLATPASAGQRHGTVPEAPQPHPRLFPSYPIPALQRLVAAHFRATGAPDLSVAGTRPLALVYLMVAALVAAPRYQAVVVVDLEGRFDASVLVGKRAVLPEDLVTAAAHSGTGHPEASAPVTEADLAHIHVLRVDPRWRTPLADIVAVAEQRVLYGSRRARDRPWWGTLVVGGGGGGSGGGASGGRASATPVRGVAPEPGLHRPVPGPALVTGYYGWLRVDALELDPQRAWDARRQRLLQALAGGRGTGGKQDVTEDDGYPAARPLTWVASSPWGSFTFQLRDADLDVPN